MSPFDHGLSRTEHAALLACLGVAGVFVAYDSALRWRRNHLRREPKPAGGSLRAVLKPKPRERSFTGSTF